MRSFFSRMRAIGSQHKGEVLSVAAHSLLLLCFVGGISRSPKVTPYRLPGTALGATQLTYYSPGSFQPLATETPRKGLEKAKATPTLHPIASAPEPVRSQVATSEAGVGTSAKSGLGEGDITIALETYFPYPTPDLAALPHGTKGDVILDAVIDEQGRISQLTLLKGLGSPVDESVIATVQQWRYTPAMKEGVPVSSERELHFHYERG
jgi:protein TonB